MPEIPRKQVRCLIVRRYARYIIPFLWPHEICFLKICMINLDKKAAPVQGLIWVKWILSGISGQSRHIPISEMASCQQALGLPVCCQGYADGSGRRTCQAGGSGGVRNPSSECWQNTLVPMTQGHSQPLKPEIPGSCQSLASIFSSSSNRILGANWPVIFLMLLNIFLNIL